MTSDHYANAELKRHRWFPGWNMVMVAFFVDFVAVGFFFYSYSVFFGALSQEFGGSRLGVAVGITLTTVVGAVAAPVIGRALDRYPIRRIIAAGTVFMTFGFAGLSFVRNTLEFYWVLAFFIGIGAASMGGLATAKLVTNWFERRRGTALGIAATGVSLSGVLMPAIAATMIESYGWRMGFLIYAAVTGFVVLPVVLRFVVSKPEDIGLAADGAVRWPDASPPPEAAMATMAVLRRREYWCLGVTVGLLFSCSSATLTHMVPRITDMGYSTLLAASVMSACGGAGVFGKMFFGWLGDRWLPRNALWLAIAAQVVGQVLMLVATTNEGVKTPPLLLFTVGVICFGVGMGGVVPLQGTVVARIFGRENFGRVLGLLRPAMLPLQVIGVPLAGWVFDVYGTYTPAFQALLIGYAAAIFVTGLLQPTQGTSGRA